MAQTYALLKAAFPPDIACTINDYFRPRLTGESCEDAGRAAKAGAYELCMKYLLSNDIFEASAVLRYACRGGHKKILKVAYRRMVVQGIEIAAYTQRYCTYGAYRSGVPDIIRFVEALWTPRPFSAARAAAKNGDFRLFTEMMPRLRQEACLSPPNVQMLWHAACRGGNMDIIKLVEDLKPRREHLVSLCSGGDITAMQYVLPSARWDSEEFNYGFERACKHGHYDAARLMLSKGITEWGVNDGLCDAAANGRIDLVRLALSEKIYTRGTLSRACECSDNAAVIQLLIDSGADDWNAGYLSTCQHGNLPEAVIMINHGATNINEGVQKALEFGHTDIVLRIGRFTPPPLLPVEFPSYPAAAQFWRAECARLGLAKYNAFRRERLFAGP